LIGCRFIAFFAWYAVLMTYDSWQFHDRAQGVLPVPLWIPQLGYAGGLVILAIAFVDEFFHVLGGGEPRYEKPKPRTAEEVIEQAIQSGV
jgi:TRAP-type C4-dicarboxylate transport system permease small subunit